jgi:serine-type D-Ala-D-Ala carboxypeptidase
MKKRATLPISGQPKNSLKRKQRMPQSLERYLESYVEKKLFSHCYLWLGNLYTKKQELEHKSFATTQEIFDLASLTKALVTAPLVIDSLCRDGSLFSLSLGEFLGEKRNYWHPKIQKFTLLELLTHSSPLPSWKNFWTNNLETKDPEEQAHARLNLWAVEGELSSPGYSDVGYIILALSLQHKHQKSLPELFARFCAQELGSAEESRLFLTLPDNLRKNAVPTTSCPLRGGLLQGVVHDENSFALGGASGHAGAFASGEGLVSYLQALVGCDVGRFFRSDFPFLANTGPYSRFGWRQGYYNKGLGDVRFVGHEGFTGTSFWLRPSDGLGVVLLVNRTISGRQSEWISGFRQQVFSYLSGHL